MFLSDPSPIIVSHKLNYSLLFSGFDWCDPSVRECQLKPFYVVSVADFDYEERDGNSLVEILKLKIVQDIKVRFGQDFEDTVQFSFWSWSLVKILKLVFGQDFEA